MKLIVAGATGMVGTEVIRQALSNKSISSVLALGRRETPVPANLRPGGDPSKLKSVLCSDFTNYSDDVKSQLSGADACIWLLAVTPATLKGVPIDEVRKICLDFPLAGLNTMKQLSRGKDGKPLRFVYASGAKAERDQTKRPWIMADYTLIRGLTESEVLEAAEESDGEVAACIMRIGLVHAANVPFYTSLAHSVVSPLLGIPFIPVEEVAAASLSLAMKQKFDKDTYLNDELAQFGQAYLQEQNPDATSS